MLKTLGTGLINALSKLNASPDVNEEQIEIFIKEVVTALLQADVNVKVVAGLRDSLRKQCAIGDQSKVASSVIKKRVYKALFDELEKILSPPSTPFKPLKGRPNVFMFVGLQGAGKTTTCTKYANYYKKRGWRVALICADTYRAGAFDQLKQNASRCKIPFYGSYTEIDAVETASKGVTLFKKERAEIIIVDTSGRHKQAEELFEEMQAIEAAVDPDEIIFVLDSHIGQACALQAQAFKDAVKVASVIVTKLDGHAKGGGAISAVATTGCSISFIGVGESFDALEPFNARSFISRLLGMGDPESLFRALDDMIPEGARPKMMQRLQKGIFTYSDLKTQLNTMGSFSSMGSMMSMIPGLSSLSGMIPQDQQDTAKKHVQRFTYIIDSMRPEERECQVELDETRIRRLAYGAGSTIEEVRALIAQHAVTAKMMGKIGKGITQMQKRGGGMPRRGRGMPQLPGGMQMPPGFQMPPGMSNLFGGGF
eukprot:Protomagalhaensia_sp_Gyna_25__998@NODE_1483_length_1798_cov_16_500853_g1200_i0_p1_GENE_NODE_1483_length_1798_cov_16_500853_g1200_i0NODE_1483_length_1798_cov_16_500853_g1200_i0_p1_ORF_typecomplete_len482_score82_52SRP54/PF00448_22/1_4e72SRP_SPB/PF02978_19/3_4e03SRP_SPB/PF02978_19/1_3e21SRP54_N/PF02881_19/4e12cobW/PF02492_19/8_7e07VirC1/PF07015_11/1_2e06Zeta_toxin/PF06414_12/8_8e06SRPRB/PF09439_10/5_7e05MobB/PF03205_14/0_00011NTPase_1/PF03266_15/0_00014MipZ/PF09140_11/0_00068APS_kinase/PF01583_20/